MASNALEYPAAYRLAFRELGLAIGLEGARIITAMADEPGASLACSMPLTTRLDALTAHLPVKGEIERFWLKPESQQGRTWQEPCRHQQRDVGDQPGRGRLPVAWKG